MRSYQIGFILVIAYLWQMVSKDPMTPVNSESALNDGKLMETVINLVTLAIGEQGAKITPHTSLFSFEAKFDSTALLELVLRLEDTFNLIIPDEDLDRDTFRSPETIVSYLRTRLRQGT